MENVGVVILNYNDYKLTEKCVNNLINLKMMYKTVIVDNTSKNNSYTYLKKRFFENKNIDVIKNDYNAGYAKGNNVGIKYLLNKYEDLKYICIMNPDIEFRYSEIIDNLVQKLKEHEELALISGNMYLSDSKGERIGNSFWNIPSKKRLIFENLYIVRKYLQDKNLNDLKIKNGVCYVEVVAGCFFVIKSDIFKEVGFFDERTFLYNEENILSAKLNEIGYKEGISATDYYIHKHKDLVNNNSIRKRIHAIKIENTSVRVFWNLYYEKGILGEVLKVMQNIRYINMLCKYIPLRLKSILWG